MIGAPVDEDPIAGNTLIRSIRLFA
jgi:hypothetical protein